MPFPGPGAGKLQIDGPLPGAKNDFWWCPVLEIISGCVRRPQSRVLASLGRVLGLNFALSDKEFVLSMKKCPLGLFLGAKIRGLLLQNHANRTVHPSKMEGALLQDYVRPYASQGIHFASQKLTLKASNCTTSHCYLVCCANSSFRLPLALFGMAFGSLLAQMMRGPAAKNCLFGASGSLRAFFAFPLPLELSFRWYLEPLLRVLGIILKLF